MTKTKYSPFDEINELQMQIMIFIDHWVRTENTPVPRQSIMKAMREKHIPAITVEGALNALLVKGYIRRGYSGSNKTSYVQIVNINT